MRLRLALALTPATGAHVDPDPRSRDPLGNHVSPTLATFEMAAAVLWLAVSSISVRAVIYAKRPERSDWLPFSLYVYGIGLIGLVILSGLPPVLGL